MRSIIFKYTLLHGKFPAPIIPIQIKGTNGWYDVWGYVDSGASFSIFGLQDAEGLGINDFQKAFQTTVTVGDGSQIPIFAYHLPVKIGDIKLKATIGFSPRLGVGFNLIGRKSIFDRFDVTFSDSRKTVTFKPVGSK